MSTEQFLNAVLPTQGLRFGLNTFGKQGDPDFRPAQRDFAVGETTDLISYAMWGSGQGANAFFAVGGYTTSLHPTTGKPQRLAHAAQWHRCLRMDVDVGADKSYQTKQQALAGIVGMNAHFGMPDPWIVDSGGGMHVYWAFDRDVTLVDWVPMASRLRAACEQYGLLGDHTTTIDAARVLRVPGTLNNKPHFIAAGAVPVVRILQVGVSSDPAAVVANLPQSTVVNSALPAALRGLGDELSANLHQPYFIKDLLKQCPGMLAMVNDGGARAQEPLWKAALDLLNKSDDSEDTKVKVARGISSGHPGFTEPHFQQKWQQVQIQNYHPPTCSRMAAAGMPECGTCPHRGKISSPLVLGRIVHREDNGAALPLPPAPVADPPAALPSPSLPSPAGAALVAAPPLPAPTPNVVIGIFSMDSSTVVKVVNGRLTNRLLIDDGFPTEIKDSAPDENGVKKQYQRHMLPYRLLSFERMLDSISKRSMAVITFDRGLDGLASIEFGNADFSDSRAFYNKLHAEGLYTSKKDAAEFLEKFMPEFLAQAQRARAASQIAGRCGWTSDLSCFVLGTLIYRADGSTEHIRTSVISGEMEGYHIAGDEAKWRRAFDIAMSGGADRQAVLALSIAGPLMAFTGLDGVLLNAYSPESGVGKSTLCDAALSIWGSPNVLRKDFRDTANATFKIASVTGNMPMVIDEFTNVEGKALSDYVYTITQGREKHRLTSDAKLSSNAQRWCLAAITTANNSVHEKLQQYRSDAVAEAARVFELRLKPLQLDVANMGHIKEALFDLRTDYGFLGPQLVKLFLSRPSQYWRDVVMGRIAKWDRESSQSAGDRFRSATCALIEIGTQLGAAMGLGFDVAAVEAVLKTGWAKQVNEFEAERKKPLDFLNGYVLRHISEFALIGGPQNNQILNPNMPRKFMGEIRGNHATGAFVPTTVMVPLEHLREYVRDANGNYKAVLEWLQSSPAVLRTGSMKFLDGAPASIYTQATEFKFDDVLGGKISSEIFNVQNQPVQAV